MKKNGVKENNLLVAIAILTVILAILGRLLSFGWVTSMLTMIPVIPIYCMLFLIATITIARFNKKEKKDYILFGFLCITMIISSFTFIDYNDSGVVNMLFSDFNNEVFNYISIVSFILNIVFSMYSLILSGKKKYIYES